MGQERRSGLPGTVRCGWRPYTMLYAGLAGLAGALLAAPPGSVWRLCGAWLVPTLGWAAGHCAGDCVTGELGVPRPRWRVGWTPTSGALGMVACALLGGVVGCLLNWRTLALAGVVLLGGIAYGSVLRAHGLAGALVRGSLTALALVFGAMAVVPGPPVPLLAVAAVFWLHDSAANLVGGLRDAAGSRAGGDDPLQVRHGQTMAVAVAALLYAACLGLAALTPAPLAGRAAHPVVFWALLGAVAVLGGGALAGLVAAPKPVGPAVAWRVHEVLTLERIVLACAFVGLSVGLPTALGLAVPAVVLSALFQAAIGIEHGFGAPEPAVRAGRVP